MTAPLIPGPLLISPSRALAVPGGIIRFAVSGGSGSAYTWAIATNQSGAAPINSATGEYTAGALYNTIDTVRVTDGLGNTAFRDVRIVPERQELVLGGFNTLATLRTTCQQRTDLVNSTFITTVEWNSWINSAAFELYDLLVTAYDNEYHVAEPYVFQTDGVTQRYPLPADFFKLLGVDVQVSNTTSGWLRVPKFNYGDRTKYMTPYQIFYGVRTNLRYRLDGNNLWLLPIAANSQYIQVLYVPRMTQLVLDTDVIDGISGWEEYIIADVAIKAQTKREQDASVYGALKADLAARIDQIAENRDAAAPGTVVDVRSQEDDDFGRGGWGV